MDEKEDQVARAITTDLSFIDNDAVRGLVAEALKEETGAFCFDADGTLWGQQEKGRPDIGEAFLHHLSETGMIPAMPKGEAWGAYLTMLKPAEGFRLAYPWAVAAMAGLKEDVVIREAAKFARTFVRMHLYPPMARLLRTLNDAGKIIYLVSASNHWVVSAAAEILGFSPERVIAIRSKVIKGVLTGRIVEPAPVAEGKVAALLAWGVRRIVLAAGDSGNDEPMLKHARYAFVVTRRAFPNPKGMEMAKRHEWPVLFV